MKYKFFALAAVALPVFPAFAQDAEEADDSDVIYVLGEGLPDTPATPAYDVQELDRDTIVSTGSGRLEDALTNIAGFQQFRRSDSRSSNPSAQGATLRALGGNATSRALVLLDGVPLADPFFGYIPFSSVAPERLDHIRVTRGGGSGPFGAGALAGTIELESALPGTTGPLSGSFLINDRSETELSGMLAPEVGDGYAVVSGRWDRGKGFYTTPEDEMVPASARARFDSWTMSARVVQPLAEGLELQVRGMAYEDNRTLRFEGADSSSEGEDVSVRLVGRGDWQFDVVGYAQWRNFTNIVVSSTRFVPVLDQKDTPSTGLGGKIEIRPPVGQDHVLRMGTDYRKSDGDLFEDAYSAFTGARTEQRFAGGQNTDLGFFLEDDWTIGPVTLTGGLRADRWTIRDGYYRSETDAGTIIEDTTYDNRSGWDVSWRGGAVFAASDAVRLRAAAYSGLRLPTLNELYRPFVVFPVVTMANAELENERLEGYEAGIDWQAAESVSFSLTAFDNKVKHAIANVTLEENLRQRRNLDAIDAQGIEFGNAIRLGGFGFDGSLAYTDATVEGTGFAAPLDGNRPSQTPKWAASGTASYRTQDGMLLSATLRHVGDQFEGDQEDDVLPAATTVDLFAQVPVFDRFSVVGRVENLFDETIITRNQGGSMDLGAPQTFWAGIRYGF